jgi:L-threonylcarbamoyladenylate synthase
VTRLSIDPVAPDAGAIEAAVRAIRGGGIVAMPTDTLYGLAANPFDTAALAAIQRLKERPTERAIPLVAADVDQIAATLGVLPMLARLLAIRFWPGPLTMLMQAPECLPAEVTGGTPRGVSPAHPIAALCARAETPLRDGKAATRTNDPGRLRSRWGPGRLLDAVTPGSRRPSST